MKISNLEKQRILELHISTPMRPYLFVLNEQGEDAKLDRMAIAMGSMIRGETDEQYIQKLKDYNKYANPFSQLNPHHVLTVLQIGTLFIPVIGPIISGTLSLAHAGLYYSEGKRSEAVLEGIFAFLPGVTGLLGKIPAMARLGKVGMGALGRKVGTLKNLSPDEIKLVNEIGKQLSNPANAKLVSDAVQKQAQRIIRSYEAGRLSGPSLQYLKKAKNMNRLQSIAKVGLDLSIITSYTTFLHDPLYQATLGDNLPETAAKKGQGLNILKAAFGAKTKDDDKLLKAALKDKNNCLCGTYDLNYPVHPKYQTQTFKNEIEKKVKAIEETMKYDDKECRFEGTFGAKIVGDGGDPYEYKFINGKYYTRKNKGNKTWDESNNNKWIDVSNNQNFVTSIAKFFENKGFKKDSKGIVYVGKTGDIPASTETVKNLKSLQKTLEPKKPYWEIGPKY